MNNQRILITGASGMLGSLLARSLAERYQVYAHYHTRPVDFDGVIPCSGDIADRSTMEDMISGIKPALVIHTAAWTDVDGCESNMERAMTVNGVASGWIAAAAHKARAAMIYISTDTVFNGLQGNYKEDDRPDPVNIYSLSKLSGEEHVMSAHPDALVIRTGPEGWRPPNRPGFIQWVLDGLKSGRQVNVCEDWVRSVVFVDNLVVILEAVWSAGLRGLYHASAPQPMSNLELARLAAEVFDLDAGLLVPIRGSDLKLAAKRPQNTYLDSGKFFTATSIRIWNPGTGLASMKKESSGGSSAGLSSAVH